MGSITTNPKKKKTRITLYRRLTQIFFIFLLNPYFFTARNICFPIMNCWGCPIAAFACPIGAMGQFFAHGVFPFMVLGTIVLFGALIGRMLCGWACPFGLLQDILYKIPLPKIKMPPFLSYGKYATLLIMVILIPLLWGIGLTLGKTTPEDFFFCRVCPAGTLEGTIPLSLLPADTQENISENINEEVEDIFGEDFGNEPEENANKKNTENTPSLDTYYKISGESIIWSFAKSPRIWILITFLVLFILIGRVFCRVICPIGAMFALFNKLSIYKMKFDKEKCIDCNICYKTCPTKHKIYESDNSPECVRCLECQKKCPTGAIENHYF